jgi:hypothetical protein
MPHLFVGTAQQHQMSNQVNNEQKLILERAFKQYEGTTPSGEQLSEIARTSGLDSSDIKSWFIRKRKREKKKKYQQAKKKAKKNAAAAVPKSEDTFNSRNVSTTSNTSSSSSSVRSADELREEIKRITVALKGDTNNSELYYARGSALISLGRDLSNPCSWGKVIDQDSWENGLVDLEKAHTLRYL